MPLESRLYRDAFVVSQALIVAFYALVVLELYSKVLRDLAGIAGIARRYIKLMLALAIVLAVLPLPLENKRATVAGYFLTYERIVMASLPLFVLFISLFLVYYPVPLGRNVVVYLMGYAVYFLDPNYHPIRHQSGPPLDSRVEQRRHGGLCTVSDLLDLSFEPRWGGQSAWW